ncbi:uncharacterized mitochondrial protein AtMg00810-like [Ricinus communis]|uniref:uncharacterized mitochondrial protein AtMg00810-like n=1 Tax=Ricinus communis TaxID=3988 RepID=UPI00201A65B8|nr:uncharacterized mitochondrial protein AtMg00810-like [Ricinus communis]
MVYISQLKYARDILTRAQLLDSKPVHTPMVVFQHLSSHGPLFLDPTFYRSLVSALQYLTITRPNIAYIVNSVSQVLHSPTEDHFLAVKRILRYVRLTFRSSAAPSALIDYLMPTGQDVLTLVALLLKQPTISRSSCESEYRALALTVVELLWLTHPMP